ncbi:MAG: hypothetical protein J6M62_07030, partial [Selenomonadaceae bacterium]|nr:hypothetical protein [Selenomonadaceae bacterium]
PYFCSKSFMSFKSSTTARISSIRAKANAIFLMAFAFLFLRPFFFLRLLNFFTSAFIAVGIIIKYLWTKVKKIFIAIGIFL